MLKTFKAFLQDGQLEWIEDVPELGNERLQVYVTVLDTPSDQALPTSGQRMAAALEQLATIHEVENIDPVQWQREIRYDRSLPER